MPVNTFTDNAKVMTKGRISIPKDIRDILSTVSGDRITFIIEGNIVRIVNSAVNTMRYFKEN